MLVYDSSAASNKPQEFECTYTTFKSDSDTASPDNPTLLLDNTEYTQEHNAVGLFSNTYRTRLILVLQALLNGLARTELK